MKNEFVFLYKLVIYIKNIYEYKYKYKWRFHHLIA